MLITCKQLIKENAMPRQLTGHEKRKDWLENRACVINILVREPATPKKQRKREGENAERREGRECRNANDSINTRHSENTPALQEVREKAHVGSPPSRPTSPRPLASDWRATGAAAKVKLTRSSPSRRHPRREWSSTWMRAAPQCRSVVRACACCAGSCSGRDSPCGSRRCPFGASGPQTRAPRGRSPGRSVHWSLQRRGQTDSSHARSV